MCTTSEQSLFLGCMQRSHINYSFSTHMRKEENKLTARRKIDIIERSRKRRLIWRKYLCLYLFRFLRYAIVPRPVVVIWNCNLITTTSENHSIMIFLSKKVNNQFFNWSISIWWPIISNWFGAVTIRFCYQKTLFRTL